jgi:lysophospholipase L1-like esterase
MLECLLLGDSIAIGTHVHKPKCEVVAEVGINSWQFNNHYLTYRNAETIIISLGTNDHKFVKTEEELRTLRAHSKGKRVFWILPSAVAPDSGVTIDHIQMLVYKVANEHGDVVIPVKKLQKDGVHPSADGYKEIIKEIN